MWTAIIFTLSVSLVWIGVLIYLAPEGYEDEQGFHLGKEDDESRT